MRMRSPFRWSVMLEMVYVAASATLSGWTMPWCVCVRPMGWTEVRKIKKGKRVSMLYSDNLISPMMPHVQSPSCWTLILYELSSYVHYNTRILPEERTLQCKSGTLLYSYATHFSSAGRHEISCLGPTNTPRTSSSCGAPRRARRKEASFLAGSQSRPRSK